jgi:DNA-binding CsgD family transcriptional regulator
VITPLSTREVECLTWAAQGKTYREISMLTGLAYGSVKTYLDAGRYKLDAVNVTHAVALAITYGIISMREDAIVARKKVAERRYGEFMALR